MVRVMVLTGFGINCDYETQTAFELAGADEVNRVHLNDVLDNRQSMDDYQILAFPGGFSFGDDIASGKVFANKVMFRLREQVLKFIEDGGLIIGICNGFQVLTKMGVLPAVDEKYFEQSCTVTFNDSGRFEDRWVYLKEEANSKCVFTKGLDKVYFPVRHGEGKFYSDDKTMINKLRENGQIALTYVDENGNSNPGYPGNPNGSTADIAGICDPTGRVFGLMPHPEAYLFPTNHPRWTRGEGPKDAGMGLKVFTNAVEHFK